MSTIVRTGPTFTRVTSPVLTTRSTATLTDFPASPANEVTLVYGRVLKYRSLSWPIVANRPDGKGKVAFVERVMPGAWTHVDGDVPAVLDHQEHRTYASAEAGTLRFKDTDTALYYAFQVRDDIEGRALAGLFDRGEVRGASMAFAPLAGGTTWTRTTMGVPARTLTGLVLRHVSVITSRSPKTWPAYPSATAALWRGSAADFDALQASQRSHPRDVVSAR